MFEMQTAKSWTNGKNRAGRCMNLAQCVHVVANGTRNKQLLYLKKKKKKGRLPFIVHSPEVLSSPRPSPRLSHRPLAFVRTVPKWGIDVYVASQTLMAGRGESESGF